MTPIHAQTRVNSVLRVAHTADIGWFELPSTSFRVHVQQRLNRNVPSGFTHIRNSRHALRVGTVLRSSRRLTTTTPARRSQTLAGVRFMLTLPRWHDTSSCDFLSCVDMSEQRCRGAHPFVNPRPERFETPLDVLLSVCAYLVIGCPSGSIQYWHKGFWRLMATTAGELCV